jgi:hypothetical protein
MGRHPNYTPSNYDTFIHTHMNLIGNCNNIDYFIHRLSHTSIFSILDLFLATTVNI